jgi:hypothetical protein
MRLTYPPAAPVPSGSVTRQTAKTESMVPVGPEKPFIDRDRPFPQGDAEWDLRGLAMLGRLDRRSSPSSPAHAIVIT